MKRIALITAVLILAAALSAQESGSLTLQGSVLGVLEITITPEPDIGLLNLNIDVTDKLIGTAIERSNKKDGYTVTLSSTNAAAASESSAFFKSADPENTDTLEYTVEYNGFPVTFSAGIAVVSDVSEKTPGAGVEKAVTISYAGGSGPLLYEDSYSDTLTFTIEAK